MGDDVRSINWKVTARSNETFINLFEEERELNVLLVVDVSGSETFGSLIKPRDYAAEIAAILGFIILHSDKVGLILFSDQVILIFPQKRKRPCVKLLRDIFYIESNKNNQYCRSYKFYN